MPTPKVPTPKVPTRKAPTRTMSTRTTSTRAASPTGGARVSGRERTAALARLRTLTRLLDSSVRLPGGFRVGLDPIIGLIPGFGDAVMLLPALYIVLEAYRLGVSRGTVVRMGVNVGVETLFGAVPVIGDLFDATFKANTRNLYLLEQHFGALGDRPLERPSNRGVLAFLAVLLVVLVGGAVLVLWLALGLVGWLFRGLGGAF